jgi:hypothetical protein
MSNSALTLVVSFDIDQEGQRLDWYFEDAHGNPIPVDQGKETGIFPLLQDNVIGTRVEVSGCTPTPDKVAIINCHLITRPTLFSARQIKQSSLDPSYAGTYPYPSPFFIPENSEGGEGATVSFGTGVATMGDEPGTMAWTSKSSYRCVNQGRWNLFFIMTAAISRDGKTSYRVFSFDPECQVGTGAVPPR